MAKYGFARHCKVRFGMDHNGESMYERTSLEEIVANELKSRGIEFAEQYPTDSGFVLDFVIAPNICLEADGPCHDSSKAKRRDWFRTKCLKLEGWKVYRLDYHVIANNESLLRKLDEILI